MGFFNKLMKLNQENINQEIQIQMNSSLIENLKNVPKGTSSINLTFDESILKEIDDAIETHSASPRVAYDDEMQFLDVVGESFHQTELESIMLKYRDNWLSGLLIPEPFNPYDSNAVMVAIIDPEDYSVVPCGHLSKQQAAKTQKKILKLLSTDAYIPLLIKLSGGTSDKPNIGVFARAKTKKISFDI